MKYQTGNIYISRIDKDDTITYVNKNWIAFARNNNAQNITLNSVIGQKIWDFICDLETSRLYEALFTRARDTDSIVKIPFRCDSPNCRRFMELQIIPLENRSLEMRSYAIDEEYRNPVDLLDPGTLRSDASLSMCSNCKKVLVHDSQWCEVEDVIVKLDLFSKPKLPQINYGMCSGCRDKFLSLIRDIRSSTS